ncbi:hypothetical protein IT401_00920 [Candidatus Nomurabacteria bacterium]|nr:hypothetical protein [Candidatus Nomurabacteria bacterium]
MKKVFLFATLFASTTLISCNLSSSGTTTCIVGMYGAENNFGISQDGTIHQAMTPVEVRVRKGQMPELYEGEDIWLYRYKNSGSEYSTWIVSLNNPFKKDTVVIEEVVPQYDARIGEWRRAKLLKL